MTYVPYGIKGISYVSIAKNLGIKREKYSLYHLDLCVPHFGLCVLQLCVHKV